MSLPPAGEQMNANGGHPPGGGTRPAGIQIVFFLKANLPGRQVPRRADQSRRYGKAHGYKKAHLMRSKTAHGKAAIAQLTVTQNQDTPLSGKQHKNAKRTVHQKSIQPIFFVIFAIAQPTSAIDDC